MSRGFIILCLAFGALALSSQELLAAEESTHEIAHLNDSHHADAVHDDAHGAAHGAAHPPPPINWIDLGYANKDVQGGSLDPGEEAMAPPLGVALINFAAFIVLLFFKIPGTKIGLNLAAKLRDFFEQKHNTIKDGLAEGERLQREAQAKLAEYGQRIKDVDAEVEELMSRIRSDAEVERQRIVAEAKAQAERTKAEAEQRIEAEIRQVRLELKRDVIVAATEAAQKTLRSQINPQDQSRIFDQFISDLGSVPASDNQAVPTSIHEAPTPHGGNSNEEGWS